MATIPQIDRNYFKEWSKTCRVKRVQEQYVRLVADAQAKGTDVQAELRGRGFRDHAAFIRSCPRFSLLCWPDELKELGSGFVLYFHFLIFLMLFLLVAFVVQCPALIHYASMDRLRLWSTEGLVAQEYLTPGNLGPDGGTERGVLFCYLLVVALFCLGVVLKHQYQLRVDRLVDAGTLQPNDFAILVKGLPATATDESEIMEFFKLHALRRHHDTEIVKVVIGWDAAEYRTKIADLRILTKLVKEMEPGDPELKRLQEQIKQIKADFASTAPDVAAKLMSSGVVVVIFRHQRDQSRCLQRWTSFWARYANSEPGGCMGLLKGCPLPQFPCGDHSVKLTVERAPNPGDINWEDLGVPRGERLTTLTRTNGFMFVLIMVAFWICYLMKWIERNVDSGVISVLSPIIVVVANSCLTIAAKRCGQTEHHGTMTEETASQSMKMAVGMIITTSGVVFASYWDPDEWYIEGGLVSSVYLLVLINGVLRPVILALFTWVDVKAIIRGRKKSKLTDDMIDGWNEVARKFCEQKGKLTKKDQQEYDQAKSQIEYFKTLFEPSDMDLTKRYAYALNIFVCSMLYCPLFPMILLLGIGSLLVQYAVDKVLLLRVVRRPSAPPSAAQAVQCLTLTRYMVMLLFPLAVWIFLHPSWKDKEETTTLLLISYVPALVFLALPLRVWRTLTLLRCFLSGNSRRVAAEQGEADYYQAQHLWPRELKYHKSHFLYKGLPNSKNPEMLEPGGSHAVGAADVKSSYGASAKAAAEGAGEAPPLASVRAGRHGCTLRREELEPLDTAGEAEAAAADPVPAATFVAAEPHPVVPVAAPAAAKKAGGPPPGPSPPVPAAAAAAAAPAPAEAGDFCWEFQSKDGYERFAEDCHGYIERKYREFAAGRGQKRVLVRTGDIKLSVDFEKMTQVVEGRHNVRSIRRSEAK